MVYNDIKGVLRQFTFEGKFRDVVEVHTGNINNTYHLYYNTPEGECEYILQQINTYAFKKPEEVMSNIRRVTEHLERAVILEGKRPNRRVLRLISTHDGNWMYRDEQNRCWRAYNFIKGAVTFDRSETPEQFREVGRAFGKFQRQLIDFPAYELNETIVDFHNTRKRFFAFVDAVGRDPVGRAKLVEDEIDFFFDRRKMMSQVVGMIEDGTLPLRVTHNDTKINNVMVDKKTGEALCVIDLDTVMPGSVLYDYGDAIRSGANTSFEDEPDTSKVALDMEMFRAFTESFVGEARTSLTEQEIRLLPLGVKIMTCELAMRFLTDYLEGDVYFKVRSPEHNLIRTRAQIKLLTDVEEKYDDLCRVMEELLETSK